MLGLDFGFGLGSGVETGGSAVVVPRWSRGAQTPFQIVAIPQF